jgi:hypothetical protein
MAMKIFFCKFFFHRHHDRDRDRDQDPKKFTNFARRFFSSTLILWIINKKISPSLHLGEKLSLPERRCHSIRRTGELFVYILRRSGGKKRRPKNEKF